MVTQNIGTGSLWRNRPFIYLWLGQCISQLGNALYYVALFWMIQQLTGSPRLLGLTGTAMTAPALLGLFTGVLVDRWDRARLLLITDVLRGLVILIIPVLHLLGVLTWWQVLGPVLIAAVLSQFFLPAKNALLPELVPAEQLQQANALNSMSLQTAQVVGYAVAGGLIAAFGARLAFWLDSLSFFVSAVFTLLMLRAWRPRAAARRAPAPAGDTANPGQTAKTAQPSFWRELRAGLQTAVRIPIVRTLIPVAVLLNFAITPLVVLLAHWAEEILQVGASGYGLLEMSLPLGMIAGSLLAGGPAKRLRPGILTGWAIGLAGAAIVLFSLVRTLPGALGFLGLTGLLMAVVSVTTLTLMQRSIPPAHMGRVFGATQAITNIGIPLGTALAGWAAEHVGAGPIFMGTGLAFLLAGALLYVNPAFRETKCSTTPKTQAEQEVVGQAS